MTPEQIAAIHMAIGVAEVEGQISEAEEEQLDAALDALVAEHAKFKAAHIACCCDQFADAEPTTNTACPDCGGEGFVWRARYMHMRYERCPRCCP